MKRVSLAGLWLFLVAVPVMAGTGSQSLSPDPEQSSSLFDDTLIPEDKLIVPEDGEPADPPSYIVLLEEDVRSDDVIRTTKGRVLFAYDKALNGFAAELDANDLATLQADKRVKLIEQNMIYTNAANVQQPSVPTWGLDRVDQRFLPLSLDYWYYSSGSDASNVHVYVLDTGIRPDHVELTPRVATATGQWYDAILDGCPNNGCSGGPFAFCSNFVFGGHGTHVAGTIGATNYGVAKKVNLHNVRVLACNGGGTTATVIAGVNWVAANHVKPAVANMSIQGPVSTAMNTAINNAVATGVVFAVAAGNFNTLACSFSPASATSALTVAASTITDARAGFSNFGTCVDLFAPGDDIPSTWNSSTSATAVLDGTSMATPHVAGTAALFFSEYPTATSTEVSTAILGVTTPGLITNPGAGSPNLLLYSRLRSRLNTAAGSLSGTGAEALQPLGVNRFYFQRYDGPLEARLTGTGLDFDLRLFYRDPLWGWLPVQISATPGSSSERILYQGPEGDYYWSVLSANGSGTYTLTWSQP